MSAKDETWEVTASHATKDGAFGPWRVMDGRGGMVTVAGDGCSNPDRARLIAAAPEMVRMLLSLEWSDGHWSVNLDGGGCPCCGNSHKQGHTTDCALVAVLRKAGVTP